MDWIYLLEDWDKRWLLLNMVINFQVPENVGSVLNRWETTFFHLHKFRLHWTVNLQVRNTEPCIYSFLHVWA